MLAIVCQAQGEVVHEKCMDDGNSDAPCGIGLGKVACITDEIEGCVCFEAEMCPGQEVSAKEY